jgi:hypothetical protein
MAAKATTLRLGGPGDGQPLRGRVETPNTQLAVPYSDRWMISTVKHSISSFSRMSW